MAVTVTHQKVATLPDEPGAEVNAGEWNANHTVSGLGTMATQDATGVAITGGAIDGTTVGATTAASGKFAGLSFTGKASGTTGAYPSGYFVDVSAQNPVGWYRNTSVGGMGFYAGSQATPGDSNADMVLNTGLLKGSSTLGFGWSSSNVTQGADTSIWRASANSILNNGAATAVTTTSRTEINKTVTAFTNAAAKATFTVTVPNAAHTAMLEFAFTAFLGTGGAIGTNEAAATTSCKVIVTRTPGVNAVASAVSTAFGAVAANVAGATTATVAAAVSAIAGAVGAANTFTIDVTITRGGGSSDNHVCLCYAKLMNANASGITIA